MRVAALAFGVLAGLVASLILALGGLDVAAAGSADRQAQAVRFGLFVIGNIGVFAAGLALAAPLAGGILLVLGAVAWAVAALLLRQSVDFVLITPPALLLVAAVFAIIAHVRRPQLDDDAEPDVEIISPARERTRAPNPMESDDGVSIPSFAGEAPGGRSPLRGADDKLRGDGEDSWDPRKRREPPPRAKPAFRSLDDEEDDEPSGFSRFALGISGILSFGLYAALAGAAVLIFWSARTVDFGGPSAAAIDAPVASSSAPAVPAAAPISSEPILAPVVPSAADPAPSAEAAQIRVVDPANIEAAAPPSEAEPDFGDVIMPIDPNAPPRLSDATELPADAMAAPSAEPTAEPTAEPMQLETADEPAGELEDPAQPASVPTTGPMMPRSMTPQMAALRNAPATGPTQTTQAAPAARASDAGL